MRYLFVIFTHHRIYEEKRVCHGLNLRVIFSRSLINQSHSSNNEILGCIYTRPDKFGTSTKLVRISLAFIRDLDDPLQIDSLLRNQTRALVKVIQFGTVAFRGGTVAVET